MGKKLDALLRRNFRTSKFKAIVNLALSRLSILKNQRQGRGSIAMSDVLELLNIGHHERALLRVEQVIKEQNMLDVLIMIELYFLLLIERVNLLEQERECPGELKEAISSLIYAATRCGEFPELQEIRAIFTSRFGKEFAARAIELRNNCGVNPKVIQKLSTKMPSLESRLKALKEIASENNIVLHIEDVSPLETENQHKPNGSVNSGGNSHRDGSATPAEEMETVEEFSDSNRRRRKYKDVADAAQAAFKSAAYAAAAARAAVELSRSESHDPTDDSSVGPKEASAKHEHDKSEIKTVSASRSDQNSRSESEDEEIRPKEHPFVQSRSRINETDNNKIDREDSITEKSNNEDGEQTSEYMETNDRKEFIPESEGEIEEQGPEKQRGDSGKEFETNKAEMLYAEDGRISPRNASIH